MYQQPITLALSDFHLPPLTSVAVNPSALIHYIRHINCGEEGWVETLELQSAGVTDLRPACLPCDLASKWQTCLSLGYGWRANDMLRGLTWLLAHSQQQELTGTQFCHYTLRRPLIREVGTLGWVSVWRHRGNWLVLYYLNPFKGLQADAQVTREPSAVQTVTRWQNVLKTIFKEWIWRTHSCCYVTKRKNKIKGQL